MRRIGRISILVRDTITLLQSHAQEAQEVLLRKSLLPFCVVASLLTAIPINSQSNKSGSGKAWRLNLSATRLALPQSGLDPGFGFEVGAGWRPGVSAWHLHSSAGFASLSQQFLLIGETGQRRHRHIYFLAGIEYHEPVALAQRLAIVLGAYGHLLFWQAAATTLPGGSVGPIDIPARSSVSVAPAAGAGVSFRTTPRLAVNLHIVYVFRRPGGETSSAWRWNAQQRLLLGLSLKL